MADWAGKTLGKVLIRDLIARGGMAEVYTGMHESLGPVAVKVMRGLLERDSEQLARFHREAEVIETLQHPNIVRMFDYAIIDESPYLVMEYIPGPSLATYLRSLNDSSQRLPMGTIAHLLESIASALDYAHRMGLVHRDIKPANILLRSPSEAIELGKPLPADVEPILTDFGLVRLLDSTMLTTSGSISGTPTYMSPEQARGEKVDKRTDIYSLGIVLYEMLAGTVPFQADTAFGMLMKHINEPPPMIKGVSLALQATVDRALAKDPAIRYESAVALAKEFKAIFNGQTISAGTIHLARIAREAAESGQLVKPRPPESRTRRWIRLGVEVTLAFILLLVILQFVGPNRRTAVTTPPPLDPSIPVGKLHFDDFNYYMDKISVTLNDNIPQPEAGTHYEVWLRGEDAKAIRDAGAILYNASGGALLEFNDPNQDNLLRNFDQVLITREKNGVTVASPTGDAIYSSAFPPQALKYIRYVIVSYDKTPDQGPLMQNLWYYSGDYINKSINGNDLNKQYEGIVQAFDANNEVALRKRTEEVINQIVGNLSSEYLDYDGDGTVDDPGDGYGSLSAGEDHLGYLQESALYTKSAANAPDSTPNIRLYSDNVQVCIQNMDNWTNEILRLALQLVKMSLGTDMKPIITQLSTLGNDLVHGVDANGNGFIDPVAGECGADTAYEHAYFMADMSIYPGPNRVPPSGK